LAAQYAARAGAATVLLEATKDGGRKILISGGGRCNILPAVARPERYVTDSSANTLKKILRSWPLAEQQAYFERELGAALVLEEETQKLFPASNRAKDVRDRLVQRTREAGARIWFEARVSGLVSPVDPGGVWTVRIQGADDLEASAVVLATGGLSVPATGSDGAGLRWAAALGHLVHPTYPALTPLTVLPPRHAQLAGISLPVTVRAGPGCPRFAATGGFLFTHRGYSGPSVLDASHLHTRFGQPLEVQWIPEQERGWWTRVLQGGAGTVVQQLTALLPNRLATQLMAEAAVPTDRPRSGLTKPERQRLVGLLEAYPLPVTADEGYKKAEVTGGGVSLAEVDPRTLESRRHPGLFLCGELLDAFGPIGGHNFLWAWATGKAAGQAAAASL